VVKLNYPGCIKSEYRWAGLKELEGGKLKLLEPANRSWILKRTIELYRLWKDQEVDLEEMGLHPMAQ
jgi:hypothetical protein